MPSIKEIEEKILDFWKEKDIFQKSINKEAPKGEYIFYDGPPFATGLPHVGHILASTIKDVIPRYYTMKGYHVRRRWGWDCHGLPIENIVEQKLKISGKKQIEEKGIDVFNQTCRENVLIYIKEWGKMVERMARWVEFENSYKTMDSTYMESVWWAVKEIWNKGLIYEGRKVLLYCPRCETPISNFEVAMDNSYKEVEEESVIVKFRIVKNQGKIGVSSDKNLYILVWTTTPWTLVANTALAIGEKIKYILVEQNGEYFILADARKENLIGDFKTIKYLSGRDLANLEYEPLYKILIKESLPVVAANFVTIEDGTGIVHIAPAYGEDDYNLGVSKKLDLLSLLNHQGKFINEAPEFIRGLNFKEAETQIKQDLQKRGLLYKVLAFKHPYPFCHRCDTQLFYNAIPSWFINIQKVKPQLLKLNEKINWHPEHLKNGRFKKGIESAPDWNISRNRYWATPLPFWKCQNDKCKNTTCVGSLKELKELAINFNEVYSSDKIEDVDLHRPYIDKIELKCEKCGSKMARVSEVLDCWVESASMPFAEIHYPFENQELFKKRFPADFVSEYIAQTRAWFYVMHVISTILFDQPPFSHVLTTGTILNVCGEKLSKSKQNYTDPWEIVNKYGADALRYYLMSSVVMESDNLLFSDREVDNVYKKIILLLSNINSFYQMYFADKVIPTRAEVMAKIASADSMDQWLISRLNNIIGEATKLLDKYEIVGATRHIKDFIDEFSTWYLKLSRDRFKKNSGGEYFGFALLELSKLIAPFMPFISEHIYQNLKLVDKKESVHLEDWPFAEGLLVDNAILKRMASTQKAVEIGLALRASAGIKVRQPLRTISFKDKEMADFVLKDIVTQAVNVGKVIFGGEDKLDTKISQELKEEGTLRELTRQINQSRKEANLSVNDKNIVLEYETSSAILPVIIQKFKKELQESCSCFEFVPISGSNAKELNVDGEKIKISFKK